MGLISMLATIFANVWPFLRESLFKSASFKRWIVRHVYSLVWLVIVTIMFLAGYQLFRAATTAHVLLRDERARNVKLTQQVAQLRRTSNTLSAKELNVLKATNAAQQSRIALYERWMTLCGMDYHNPSQYPEGIPTCAATIAVRPTTPPTRKRPKPKRQSTQTPSPQPPSHITEQVQDIWSRQ